MLKYIGSKRALMPWITSVVSTIRDTCNIQTAADLFSGSGRVGVALKEMGLSVISNDTSAYSATVARCLIAADGEIYTPERIQPILDRLNALPRRAGWFTNAYATEARYFTVSNASRIDAIRDRIDEYAEGDEAMRSILLTSLLFAADKVDSTAGVQMAYLKQYAPRALNDLTLRVPPLTPGTGVVHEMEAQAAALQSPADLVYLDPPYNQHSYLGNYHVWETIVRNDRPEVYGIARKRIDCRERKSEYNSKPRALAALVNLIGAVRCDHILLSFSDEGYIPRAELQRALEDWGPTLCLARGHERYIGARIGIHNPEGKKVGTVSHTRNTEYLFLASRSPDIIAAVRREHRTDIVGA